MHVRVLGAGPGVAVGEAARRRPRSCAGPVVDRDGPRDGVPALRRASAAGRANQLGGTRLSASVVASQQLPRQARRCAATTASRPCRRAAPALRSATSRTSRPGCRARPRRWRRSRRRRRRRRAPRARPAAPRRRSRDARQAGSSSCSSCAGTTTPTGPGGRSAQALAGRDGQPGRVLAGAGRTCTLSAKSSSTCVHGPHQPPSRRRRRTACCARRRVVRVVRDRVPPVHGEQRPARRDRGDGPLRDAPQVVVVEVVEELRQHHQVEARRRASRPAAPAARAARAAARQPPARPTAAPAADTSVASSASQRAARPRVSTPIEQPGSNAVGVAALRQRGEGHGPLALLVPAVGEAPRVGRRRRRRRRSSRRGSVT